MANSPQNQEQFNSCFNKITTFFFFIFCSLIASANPSLDMASAICTFINGFLIYNTIQLFRWPKSNIFNCFSETTNLLEDLQLAFIFVGLTLCSICIQMVTFN